MNVKAWKCYAKSVNVAKSEIFYVILAYTKIFSYLTLRFSNCVVLSFNNIKTFEKTTK